MDLRRLSHLVRLPETAPVKSATYNKMIWGRTFKKFYASPFKTLEHSVNQILPAKKLITRLSTLTVLKNFCSQVDIFRAEDKKTFFIGRRNRPINIVDINAFFSELIGNGGKGARSVFKLKCHYRHDIEKVIVF